MLLKRIKCSVHYKARDKFLLFWMSAETETWCHVMFLPSAEAHTPTGVQFGWDPSRVNRWFHDSLTVSGKLSSSQKVLYPEYQECWVISADHSCTLGSSMDIHSIPVLPAALHCWHSKRCTSFVLLTSQIPCIRICLVIPWGPALLVSSQILWLLPFQFLFSSDMEALAGEGSQIRGFSCLFYKHTLTLQFSFSFCPAFFNKNAAGCQPVLWTVIVGIYS